MAAQDEATRIFISYAPEDEMYLRELEQHLALLQKQALIATWHARKIGAGQSWKQAIADELEIAHIVLLLVSSDFIASDYCYGVEMARALERQVAGEARVIPVILRDCDWHTAPFAAFPAFPSNGTPVRSWPDRDEAWASVVRAVRAALSSEHLLQPSPARGHNSPDVAKAPKPLLIHVRRDASFDVGWYTFAKSKDMDRATRDDGDQAIRWTVPIYLRSRWWVTSLSDRPARVINVRFETMDGAKGDSSCVIQFINDVGAPIAGSEITHIAHVDVKASLDSNVLDTNQRVTGTVLFEDHLGNEYSTDAVQFSRNFAIETRERGAQGLPSWE